VTESVEEAVRSEIRGLDVEVGSSALAAMAFELARRLDAGPGDRNAVDLAHELRMVLIELRNQVGSDATSDVERFLDGVANPSFRGPGD
jgi:hypothetical protein